jgi:hypothetical protein
MTFVKGLESNLSGRSPTTCVGQLALFVRAEKCPVEGLRAGLFDFVLSGRS